METMDELRAAFASLGRRRITATMAAWPRQWHVARLLGCSSLFVPANTVKPASIPLRMRVDRLQSATRCGGEAAATADLRTLVISDTSGGLRSVPLVIEGYSTILEEVDEQLHARTAITGHCHRADRRQRMAEAVAQHYAHPGVRARIWSASGVDAACVMASA